MQTYRFRTKVSKERTLTIKELPFHAGERVDIIVRSGTSERKLGDRYPLRGKLVRYIDPFGSAAEDDWDVLK